VGVVGVGFAFYFAKRIWNDDKVAKLASLITCTTIAPVYLSRTPMYDWPAAIFYFGFVGFYYCYILEDKKSDLAWALILIGIGSMSRFSICLGLAGIFMGLVHIIHRRSVWLLIRDWMLLCGAIGVFNFAWLMGQVETKGGNFIKAFIYDNTGRYVKSTRPDARFRADFYGFSLYTLVGMLPFTFCVIGSFFQKGIFKRIKENKTYLVMLAAFLPCLLLFSFSGHTKLARYISYVFPCLILLLAHMMVHFDLAREAYRKKCGKMTFWTGIVVGLVLVQQAIQFWAEVQESWLFVGSVILLLFPLLFLAYDAVVNKFEKLRSNAEVFLLPFGLIYCLFFSLLAYLSTQAPFLKIVHDGIRNAIG